MMGATTKVVHIYIHQTGDSKPGKAQLYCIILLRTYFILLRTYPAVPFILFSQRTYPAENFIFAYPVVHFILIFFGT